MQKTPLVRDKKAALFRVVFCVLAMHSRFLHRMLEDAQRRRFDVVMPWAIDRLGRSLQTR